MQPLRTEENVVALEDVRAAPIVETLRGDGLERRVSSLESFVADATKEFRNIDVRLTGIEAVMPHLATKADLADLRSEIKKVESTMIKWSAGFAVAIITAVIATGVFFR